MKIINLKRVLGSLSLVFVVASCSAQADVNSLDSFTDVLKPGNDRTGEPPKTRSKLSLIKIADNILYCSRADCGAPSSTHPIQILSDCEKDISPRKIKPGLLALRRIHFRNSPIFSFAAKRDPNASYQLADVALLAIPPDYY